jgi:hypothetical protein
MKPMSTAMEKVGENETKIEATDRLRREGRWPAFSERREQLRLQYRAEGMSKSKAVAASWRQAVAEYPPEMKLVVFPIDQVQAWVRQEVDSIVEDWYERSGVWLPAEVLVSLRANFAYAMGHAFEEMGVDLLRRYYGRDKEANDVLDTICERVFAVSELAANAYAATESEPFPGE